MANQNDRIRNRRLRAYGVIAAAVLVVVALILIIISLLSGNKPVEKPTPSPTATAGITAAPSTDVTSVPTETPTAEITPVITVEPTAQPTTPALTGVFKMTNTTVNFRPDPTTDGTPIKKLTEGVVVQLIRNEMGDDSSWSQVVLDGQTGYLKTEFISDCKRNPVCALKVEESMNVRAEASSSSAVVVQLDKTAIVTITEFYDEDWVKIKTQDDKVGYCKLKYLKDVDA